MDYIVTATAGHVDHGKTTLIKRLTGTDTDTAPEEKERGLTINLGFAYFDLPSKKRIAFVDVPGHEKFLKNMISGLTGIDMALLVVDAGEGVMPQTREHASILMLLGIRKFVIAVTKADTVDDEMCELTIEDIREQFSGTILENAPLVVTDAVSGRGIAELISVLDQTASTIQRHPLQKQPRLNIDRVFTIKGHGTVVTGTLIDGQINVGDQLEIYPTQIPIRVKNIQVNDMDQELALPDHRVALNLDVKNERVHKGEVVTTPGNIKDSKVIDVQFTMLNNVQPLKLNERVRLYIGSMEVFGRIYPMKVDTVKANTTCFMQIRLEKAIAVKNGDRFIIRTYSPMVTVGGGKILSANAKHHSRNNQSIFNTLQLRANGNQREIIVDYLSHSKNKTATISDLINLLDTDDKSLTKILNDSIEKGSIVKIATNYFTNGYFRSIESEILNILIISESEHPLMGGIPRPELISKISQFIQLPLGSEMIKRMVEEKKIKVNHDLVSTMNFSVQLNQRQSILKSKLKEQLAGTKLTPIALDELIQDRDTQAILTAFDGQDFIQLNDDYYLGIEAYHQIISSIKQYLNKHPDGIGISEYRDLTNTSRKYAVMVLERLEKDHITKRLNRTHVLS